MAEENVVTQNERHIITGNEFLTDNQSFGNAARLLLRSVAEGNPPATAVAQDLLEHRQMPGRGDYEYVANPRQHQH